MSDQALEPTKEEGTEKSVPKDGKLSGNGDLMNNDKKALVFIPKHFASPMIMRSWKSSWKLMKSQ